MQWQMGRKIYTNLKKKAIQYIISIHPYYPHRIFPFGAWLGLSKFLLQFM